ncbi:MAG: alpha/beta hydrolase, partial [Promethearchaeota archaeon]
YNNCSTPGRTLKDFCRGGLSSSLSVRSRTTFTIDSSSLYSTYVADTYNIKITVPNDHNETAPYCYPVIYLLDAAYHFDGTHPFVSSDVGPGGVVRILEELILEGYLPPSILVGIDYNGNVDAQRYRDFRDNRSPFYKFVEHELLPFVDDTYRTDITDRTLLGHSLGGTFTTYCLFQYNSSSPSLFKRFVTLSGNYRTDVFDVLTAESAMYERISKSINPSVNISVFLAVGGQDDPLFVSGNKNLTTRLNSRKYQDFRFNGTIYEDHDHGSVVRPGFTEGLQWVFSAKFTKSATNTASYSVYGIFSLLIVVLVVKLSFICHRRN